MAPLDLDKYVEIARLCKYLPENDLKVSPAGAGALLTGSPLPAVGRPPAGPSSLRGTPRRVSRLSAVEGPLRCHATRSDPASRQWLGEPSPQNAVLVASVGIPRDFAASTPGSPLLAFGLPQDP
ncbi:hypothetical protein P7K49_001700 [Saguinus oedipus]|uniref:Uncharacterized protein n=1 Tax=Saguinus oedipus TaxID=9490 RepID=A0ABQ9WF74_SAGOE|nr:hypothetical protein P7K49_001700 [Saguinus oedipus]